MAGWRVKFDGVCSRCGTSLLRGQEAVWDRSTRSMHCVECPTVSEPPLLVVEPSIDAGVAGGSARREFERRSGKREARIDQKFGRFAGLFKAITVEPQSTRAWAIGARGEEKLAQALAGIDGVRVLHDRCAPGIRSRANIDHVVIGPAGVFVVDAKRLVGRIEIRNRGGFFRSDWRLTVGGRDQSKLARAMTWQWMPSGRRSWPPASIPCRRSRRSCASSMATGR